jgi:hypothetical protein
MVFLFNLTNQSSIRHALSPDAHEPKPPPTHGTNRAADLPELTADGSGDGLGGKSLMQNPQPPASHQQDSKPDSAPDVV